jgi:hypothetical protein
VARSPKVQAEQSAFASEAPLWWDVADVSADGGSDRFTVSYDVRNVPGAKGTLVEISAGATDFLRGVFFTGNIVNANLFTNPQGDRPDAGNRLGQPGASARVPLAGSVAGTHTVSAAQLGLAGPPPDACDRTYDLRVFATDGAGHILGAASRTSLISLVDLTAPGCRS